MIRKTPLFLALICVFLGNQAKATTSIEVFKKYPNKYFIESGSYLGDGIQMAIEAGFTKIYSIEISPYFHQTCLNRYRYRNNVEVFLGNSAEILPLILQYVDAQATFWLDGHYSGGNTGKGASNTPLLDELEAISRHPIKTHTILIDDTRDFGTEAMDCITLDEVIQKIRQINPDYRISYENGHVPGDVLVAEVTP